MSIEKSTKTELPSIPLFPLPYYSIARAAEQLQITEEYIIESIKCGMVRGVCCLIVRSRSTRNPEYLVILLFLMMSTLRCRL